MKIFEGLRAGDLKNLVLPLISIDEYKSKLGNDDEVIVVAFFVKDEDPAIDLSRFIEKGANHILDTEPSPAPNEDGYYLVFLEFTRGKKFIEELNGILDEIKLLVDIEDWKFKPFEYDKEIDLNDENLNKFLNLKKKKKKLTNEDIGDYLSQSYANTIILENNNVKIGDVIYNHEFEVVDFDIYDRAAKLHGLTKSPLDMSHAAKSVCGTLQNILGEQWTVVAIKSHYLISRNDDPRVLILK